MKLTRTVEFFEDSLKGVNQFSQGKEHRSVKDTTEVGLAVWWVPPKDVIQDTYVRQLQGEIHLSSKLLPSSDFLPLSISVSFRFMDLLPWFIDDGLGGIFSMLCRFCLLILISLNIPPISTRTAMMSLVVCCSPTQSSLQLSLEKVPFQRLSQNRLRLASRNLTMTLIKLSNTALVMDSKAGPLAESFPIFRFSAQENKCVLYIYIYCTTMINSSSRL